MNLTGPLYPMHELNDSLNPALIGSFIVATRADLECIGTPRVTNFGGLVPLYAGLTRSCFGENYGCRITDKAAPACIRRGAMLRTSGQRGGAKFYEHEDYKCANVFAGAEGFQQGSPGDV